MIGQAFERSFYGRTQKNSEYEGNEKDPATFEQLRKKQLVCFQNAVELITTS